VRIGKRNKITRRIALASAVGVFALTVSLAGGGVRAASTRLQAGVGVADITPDLGRNFDGYVRPDILANGVATRLWARTLVLTRGARKIALVSVDLVGALGDMHHALAGRVADLGLTENNILLLGSHTHSGPDMMINTTSTPTIEAGNPGANVKAFLVQQIALSVRRAYANLRPASIGWSSVSIPNASDNRSLEAHVANFGIDAPPHTKTPADDPKGPLDAIDPVLGLLRIDAVEGSGAICTDILHFRARVLVIQAARAATKSDADPGHGSARLLGRPRDPFLRGSRLQNKRARGTRWSEGTPWSRGLVD